MISTVLLGLHFLGFLALDATFTSLYILGISLIVLELLITSFGIFAFNGIIALYIARGLQTGSLTLFGLSVGWGLIFGIALVELISLLAFVFVFLHYQKKKVTTGLESMTGETAKVLSWDGHEGKVRVQGEEWKATADQEFKQGDIVIVQQIKGLTLTVSTNN